jgi:hypothetical protein
MVNEADITHVLATLDVLESKLPLEDEDPMSEEMLKDAREILTKMLEEEYEDADDKASAEPQPQTEVAATSA